jgi:hypothetical protein
MGWRVALNERADLDLEQVVAFLAQRNLTYLSTTPQREGSLAELTLRTYASPYVEK